MKWLIVIPLFVVSLLSHAEIRRVGINVEQGQLYFEISMDSQFSGKTLEIGAMGNATPTKLLSSYYYYGMKNDIQALKGLHYSGDGSLSHLNDELVDIPDKFEGFSTLNRISLGDIYIWENYYVVDVVWHTKTEGDIRWMDLVVCNSGCYISNRIYRVSDQFSFLSNMLNLINKYPLISSPSVFNGASELCIGKIGCVNPIKVSAKFKKGSSKNNLIEISDADKVSKNYPKLISLTKILNESKASSSAFDSYLEKEAYTKKLFGCCWLEVNENEQVKLFDMQVLQSKPSQYKVSYYSPMKLFDFFKDVEYVHLHGVLTTDGTEYAFTKIKHLNYESSMLQIFAFSGGKDASAWKLTSKPKNFALNNILNYSGVAIHIDRYISNQ